MSTFYGTMQNAIENRHEYIEDTPRSRSRKSTMKENERSVRFERDWESAAKDRAAHDTRLGTKMADKRSHHAPKPPKPRKVETFHPGETRFAPFDEMVASHHPLTPPGR